jgi:hypothetical protein
MKAGGALLAPPTRPPGGMGLSDCLPARGTKGTERAAHRGRCFRVSPRRHSLAGAAGVPGGVLAHHPGRAARPGLTPRGRERERERERLMTRPTAIGHQVFSLFPLIVSCVFCRFGTRIVSARLRESKQTEARLMYYHPGCAQP